MILDYFRLEVTLSRGILIYPYRSINHLKKTIIFLLSASLLLSCSVRGDLVLTEKDSGSLEMDFSLAPFFGQFFTDLVDDNLLIEDTKFSFSENETITDYEVTKEENSYHGKIYFDSLEKLTALENGEKQSVFVEEKKDGETTLNLTLSRENWNQLSSLVPFLSDPTVAMFGPEASMGLSEAEFREMITYPFEGYASSTEEAAKAFDNSLVEFTLTVPGRITSQKGGEVAGNRVTFPIPLIRILMLDQTLTYSVSYIEE
jgi:hypothetical protein